MGKVVSLAFTADAELDERLSNLAEETRQPKSWHLEQALESYLEHEEWVIRRIKEGIREADAGLLVPNEEVAAWIKSLGTDNPLPRPRPRDGK